MINRKANKLTTSAMLASLICLATLIIRIPTIGTNGYINLGDSTILITSWILECPYCMLCAGIGSGLADFFSGYNIYIPGTFVIKFIMSFAISIIYNKLIEKDMSRKNIYIISSIISAIIMIIGYFIYESLILGYGIGASMSIIGNIIQEFLCSTIALMLICHFKKENCSF